MNIDFSVFEDTHFLDTIDRREVETRGGENVCGGRSKWRNHMKRGRVEAAQIDGSHSFPFLSSLLSVFVLCMRLFPVSFSVCVCFLCLSLSDRSIDGFFLLFSSATLLCF